MYMLLCNGTAIDGAKYYTSSAIGIGMCDVHFSNSAPDTKNKTM